MDPRSSTLQQPGETPPAPAPGSPDQPGGGVPKRLLATLAVLLALAGTGSIVRVPLHSVGPGPARDVLSLIQVHGASTHPSRGQLLLTTATLSRAPLSIWEAVYVWLDPNLSAIGRHDVVPPGFTDQQQSARNTFDMEESKLAAELAAFDALGRPAARIGGARVISVIAGGPSDGVLEPRDVIVAIAGRSVRDPGEARDAIGVVEVGDRVPLRIRRGGDERTVEVVTGADPDDPSRPIIGAYLAQAWRMPHDVEIDTADVGGPSGGLVFALAIVDALTLDDLTRGHVIAATGTIVRGDDGVARVGVIGAVSEKVRAARAAGATVFLLPADELAEAQRLAPEEMIVIGVGTLQDAIEALRRLPPRPEA